MHRTDAPAAAGAWDARRGEGLVAVGGALLLCALAFARPIDHDESQYVAAAALTAAGLHPYRDFGYLQTPLQPYLFAPIAAAASLWTWPALRFANALLGAAALFCTWRAARLVAPPRLAAAAVVLFAACDIFLFSVGTARNDALPAACLAAALWLAVRAEQGAGGRRQAVTAGLLLAAAAAAKVSYALPALAYGGWALFHARTHRPGWVALGALPIAAFVGWTAAQAPAGFLFGVVTFPSAAPIDFYADRPWKLSAAAKLLDLAKFLALGPALLALLAVVRPKRPSMLACLILAGFLAAALPTPTWRQYLLPVLPPLFVLLAWRWAERPAGRAWRIAFAIFAGAGIAPTAAALASGRPAMVAAQADAGAIRAAMDAAGVSGLVATLAPQFLPATGRLPDPRFAAGPFWFRTRTLSAPPGLPLLARADLPRAPLPAAILTGGEGKWTSGDDRLDAALGAEAARRGYRRIAIAGTRFVIWVRR